MEDIKAYIMLHPTLKFICVFVKNQYLTFDEYTSFKENNPANYLESPYHQFIESSMVMYDTPFNTSWVNPNFPMNQIVVECLDWISSRNHRCCVYLKSDSDKLIVGVLFNVARLRLGLNTLFVCSKHQITRIMSLFDYFPEFEKPIAVKSQLKIIPRCVIITPDFLKINPTLVNHTWNSVVVENAQVMLGITLRQSLLFTLTRNPITSTLLIINEPVHTNIIQAFHLFTALYVNPFSSHTGFLSHFCEGELGKFNKYMVRRIKHRDELEILCSLLIYKYK